MLTFLVFKVVEYLVVGVGINTILRRFIADKIIEKMKQTEEGTHKLLRLRLVFDHALNKHDGEMFECQSCKYNSRIVPA